MIEPTDTETKEEMDKFISVMKRISEEAYTTPQTVMSAPQNTTVTKVDEVKAAHPKTMALSWKMYKQQKSSQ
jgi:glycine dehydrogenase subunit 2